jgi:magnesium transporter
LFDEANQRVSSGGQELLGQWRQNTRTIVWIDLANEPPEREKQFLQQAFGLHEMAIQDAQRRRHPPKVERFDAVTFILLKGLSAGTRDLELSTVQLAQFVGERFLVTRRSGDLPDADALFAAARGDADLLAHGPGPLAMQLCRRVVDRYLRILLELEPRLETLEDDVVQRPDDAMLAELLGYKTELKKFRRVFLYHQQVFQELKTRTYPGFGVECEHEIVDVHEHQERAGSLAGLYYELAADLADGYMSVSAHHLNQIMKILTVVMSVFVPLSFLAGIYGMNFENMPELHSRWGYFILLGCMGVIAMLLLTIFRKKHWL